MDQEVRQQDPPWRLKAKTLWEKVKHYLRRLSVG